MKRFLLPTLTVAVLAGSAKAEDPSAATAWECTSQTSGIAKYVVNGNELKKRDDDLERYEACRRKHPAPTPEPDGKISPEAILADPCDPVDIQSYTFQIVLNNQYGLIAVSPEAEKRDNAFIWIAGRMIIIDKLTGKYVETLLSAPTLPPNLDAKKQGDASISVAGFGGTCDVMPQGNDVTRPVAGVVDGSDSPDAVVEVERKPITRNDTQPGNPSVAGVVDGSDSPDAAVEVERKPMKKSDTHEAQVHDRRHHRHHHRR